MSRPFSDRRAGASPARPRRLRTAGPGDAGSRRRRAVTTALLASALPAFTSWAQQAPAGPQSAQLPGVEVLGHYENGVGTSSAASEGAVTQRLIENRPALRPGEVLEFVPGLIVTQHSGSGKANQYFLRGFNLDHGTDFATFVDGMPVNMPTHAHGHGYTDVNFLIPELVSRIAYRKGPYFAQEGDFASAGSARVSLADALPHGLAQLTLGEHGYRRALLGDGLPLAGGTLLGALELQAEDGPWQLPERLRKVNGLLRWSERTDTRERSITLMGYSSRWKSTDQIPQRAVDDGRLDRFGFIDGTDGGRTRRSSVSAQWHEHVDGGSWQASAYAIASRLNLWSNFTYFLDDETHGDQFEQAERRRVLGAALARSFDFTLAGRDAQVTVGLQLRQDRLDPVGLYATVARQRIATTQESTVRQALAGVYGELSVAATPWLRAVAGLRADRFHARVGSSIPENAGSSSSSIVQPKLSLIAGPWAKTEAFLNLGRGFHSNDARGTVARVSPKEGTLIEAVPPLVASRGTEIGLRTEALRGLQSSLALWRLDLGSELVFVGDAGDTEASRASRREGIEWNNHWQLDAMGWKDWLLDVDLSASRARFTTDAPEGNRVPGAVNRVASIGVAYAPERGRWFGDVQLRYFGPRDLVEDGSQRSQSTALTYLRVGFRPTPQTRIALDVFNLFDRKASDIDYFYTSRLAGEPSGGFDDRHFHPVEPRTFRVTAAVELR